MDVGHARALKLDRGFAAKHRDKNVWSAFALAYYLDETGDYALLDEKVPFKGRPDRRATIFQHVCLGLDWLLRDRSKRGLNLLGEGDWCDPLNMAGVRMRGESVWLSQALVHSLDVWAGVAGNVGHNAVAARYRREATKVRRTINRLAWDGRWYAAGFTDEGRPFGVSADREGRMWLNAQEPGADRRGGDRSAPSTVIRSVRRMLESPNGPIVAGPAYTAMDEDIGRITIKVPGTNENGSFYCHAGSFWAYALYQARQPEEAFWALRQYCPGAAGIPTPASAPGSCRSTSPTCSAARARTGPPARAAICPGPARRRGSTGWPWATCWACAASPAVCAWTRKSRESGAACASGAASGRRVRDRDPSGSPRPPPLRGPRRQAARRQSRAAAAAGEPSPTDRDDA